MVTSISGILAKYGYAQSKKNLAIIASRLGLERSELSTLDLDRLTPKKRAQILIKLKTDNSKG